MTDTITVALSRPLEVGKDAFTSLTFRDAELGDAIAADAVTGEMSKVAAMLASMCGVPLPAFKRLSMKDMSVVLATVGHLLGNDESATAPIGA